MFFTADRSVSVFVYLTYFQVDKFCEFRFHLHTVNDVSMY